MDCMAKRSPIFAGDPALVALGAEVRRLRSEIGLSQEALADIAEVDRSYMGGVERGEHNLSLMRLMKIAHALRSTPSDLLNSAGL
jgi:transcriptional regulator with XRE-family HTH domain